MTRSLSATDLYPDNRVLVDYASGRHETSALFGRIPGRFDPGPARPLEAELVDAILSYNQALGCSRKTLDNVRALGEPAARCVIGGHQAIFLGGPAFTVYKILSVVRLAQDLGSRFGSPIVPVFWLASEDHDFGEINRARFLEPDGALRTVTFDWAGQGRPIEALARTGEVASAFEQTLDILHERPHGEVIADLLQPEPGDDYSTWQARLWSRLFADDGLIVIEPRTLRPFAGAFMHEVLRQDDTVREALHEGAHSVRSAGYEPALDPDRVGRPFLLDNDGRRHRIDRPAEYLEAALEEPGCFSSDAALRPILADRLLPTIASVLGPGELAYQAILKPLYDHLNVWQPVLVPRHGYTILDKAEEQLLDRLGLEPRDVITGSFNAGHVLENAGSSDLRKAFEEARRRVGDALEPLRSLLDDLDPGLDARWKQTVHHAEQGLDRLEDRARRVDLARRGISAAAIRRLVPALRPAGKLQERGLSFAHFASLYGVEWLRKLPGADEADRFAHHIVTLTGET